MRCLHDGLEVVTTPLHRSVYFFGSPPKTSKLPCFQEYEDHRDQECGK